MKVFDSCVPLPMKIASPKTALAQDRPHFVNSTSIDEYNISDLDLPMVSYRTFFYYPPVLILARPSTLRVLCTDHKYQEDPTYHDDGTFSYDNYIKIAITHVPKHLLPEMSSVFSSAVVRHFAAVSKKVRAYTFCDEGHLVLRWLMMSCQVPHVFLFNRLTLLLLSECPPPDAGGW